ncbi:MAG: ATP-binding protein [Nevskiales bacterium]
MAKPTLLSWSSGKDSAWALYQLQQSNEYDVRGLVTTINQQYQRVAMHAVRLELLQRQADAAGLPLTVLALPWPCSNEDYESIMSEFVTNAVAQGIECMAFGDLFLEDVRAYRLKNLQGSGLEAVFPLWGMPTDRLAREMVDAGLRATLTCVDPRQLSGEWAGRLFDHDLLEQLPAGVDPCGENGEFHSYAWAGPMFKAAIQVEAGEVVERDGFVFADLLPGKS